MGEDATVEALMSTGRELDLLFDNIGNGDIPAAIIPARSAGMAWSASAAAGSTLAIRARSAAASPPIETPSEPRVGLFPSLADLLASHGHLGGRAASGDAQSRDTFGGAASLDNFISALIRRNVVVGAGGCGGNVGLPAVAQVRDDELCLSGHCLQLFIVKVEQCGRDTPWRHLYVRVQRALLIKL